MVEVATILRLPSACCSARFKRAVSAGRRGWPSSSIAFTRSYAAPSTIVDTKTGRTAKGRRVTILNDDGRVRWGELSTGEKVARTTRQSFNFGLIAIGAAATIGVVIVLYTDIFSTQSAISHFNRSVDRIRQDTRVTDLLGRGSEIRAFGEPSWSRWSRNKPLASKTETDKLGTLRLYMHYNLAGPLNEGIAHLHLLRRHDENEFHYGYLVVDVKGHPRIHVEGPDAKEKKKSTPGTFLGIRWT